MVLSAMATTRAWPTCSSFPSSSMRVVSNAIFAASRDSSTSRCGLHGSHSLPAGRAPGVTDPQTHPLPWVRPTRRPFTDSIRHRPVSQHHDQNTQSARSMGEAWATRYESDPKALAARLDRATILASPCSAPRHSESGRFALRWEISSTQRRGERAARKSAGKNGRGWPIHLRFANLAFASLQRAILDRALPLTRNGSAAISIFSKMRRLTFRGKS